MTSIFTKIITREIPQEIIYEDDSVIVIPTIEPITPGHLLVIPKQEVDVLWDLDPELYAHVTELVANMARHLAKVYPEYIRIGSVVEGFGVPHAHVHVFGYREPLEATITHHIAHKHAATTEELKTEADKIRAIPFA